MTCGVFTTTNGNPDQVRIGRSELTDAIKESLAREKVVLVSGPSKIGKTVLIDQYLNFFHLERIKLSGKALVHEDSLQNLLLDHYKIQARNEHFALQQRLENEQVCIVIDDIHFVKDFSVLEKSLELIKSFIDIADFILIGIPSEYVQFVEEYPQFDGRRFVQFVDSWTEDELIQIGEKGFEKLGVTRANLRLPEIAQESLGSPFIMQVLCSVVCEEFVLPKLKSNQPIEPITTQQFKYAAWKAANSDLENSFYHRLISQDHSHPRWDDLIRLDNENRVTINELLWRAIAGEYFDGDSMPFHWPVRIEKIRNRINKMTHEDERRFFKEEIKDALRYMIGKYKEYRKNTLSEERHDTIMYLSKQTPHSKEKFATTEEKIQKGILRFCVNDPFILFYARHYSKE